MGRRRFSWRAIPGSDVLFPWLYPGYSSWTEPRRSSSGCCDRHSVRILSDLLDVFRAGGHESHAVCGQTYASLYLWIQIRVQLVPVGRADFRRLSCAGVRADLGEIGQKESFKPGKICDWPAFCRTGVCYNYIRFYAYTNHRRQGIKRVAEGRATLAGRRLFLSKPWRVVFESGW